MLVAVARERRTVGFEQLAEGTAASVFMPEGERVLLESPIVQAGVSVRPYTPDVLLSGGETIETAGISFDVISVPGHLMA